MELTKKITPENLENTELELIQKCGMPLRKANYIKGIANSAITKEVDFEKLNILSIKELSLLKGIGEWTAEMILIHSL